MSRKFDILPVTNHDKDQKIPLSRDILPKDLDLRNKLFSIRDQGESGMCAGFAGACIKEYQEREISSSLMSPEYIFYHRPNRMIFSMNIRDLMESLKQYGSVREQELPFNNAFTDAQVQKLEAVGRNFTISNYARCDTIPEIQQALNKYGPCIVAVPVYENAVKNTTTPWAPCGGNDVRIGGHAMVICGYLSEHPYNKDLGPSFIIRNSWGQKWGDKGYTYMPFTDFVYVWDVYVTTDAPTNISEIPGLPDSSPKQTLVRVKGCSCIIS